MTEKPTIETAADHINFVALAAVPTNEQRIVVALEQIVVLLTTHFDGDVDRPETVKSRAEQIAALGAKTMGKSGRK